jgi:Spy/CpxP family protein refolding chaperone
MKMQNMIRGLLYLGIAAGLSFPAVPVKAAPARAAQDTANKRMNHDRLQDAVNQLDLNDDQKGKLKDVFAGSKTKRQSIMSDSSLNDDQRKEKMKSLHEDTLSKVNEVLTPDQQTQLKEKLAAAKSKKPM